MLAHKIIPLQPYQAQQRTVESKENISWHSHQNSQLNFTKPDETLTTCAYIIERIMSLYTIACKSYVRFSKKNSPVSSPTKPVVPDRESSPMSRVSALPRVRVPLVVWPPDPVWCLAERVPAFPAGSRTCACCVVWKLYLPAYLPGVAEFLPGCRQGGVVAVEHRLHIPSFRLLQGPKIVLSPETI